LSGCDCSARVKRLFVRSGPRPGVRPIQKFSNSVLVPEESAAFILNAAAPIYVTSRPSRAHGPSSPGESGARTP
jgi:hypothetical protein